MRIIGGTGRSTILTTPRGRKTRPTSNRVREALFNIIGIQIVSAVFVDGFAGSGSVGIEALSRGAAWSCFIEKSMMAVSCIKKNIQKAGVETKATVLKNDILKGLGKLSKDGIEADIIFLDPPYGSPLLNLACREILNRGLLNKHGFLVLEHDMKEEINPLSWQLVSRRKYGNTILSFLQTEQ